MNHVGRIALFLATAFTTSALAPAGGEITIEVYTGEFDGSGEIVDNTESIHTNMPWDANTPITFGAGGLPSITDPGGFTRINIFATDEDDLGLITVQGSGTNNVHLIIGTETRATVGAPTGDFARHCNGIVAQRPIRLKMSIDGDIRANVLCTDIRRIDADGSHIAGDIQASVRGPRMVFIGGDIESGGAFPPRIRGLGAIGVAEVNVGGELAGAVFTSSADVDVIEVGAGLTGTVDVGGNVAGRILVLGDIGTSLANATISAKGEIEDITALGDVWADISVNDGEEVEGPVATFLLPRLELFSVEGDLHGTFHGPSIAALQVGGDLYADLIVGLIRHGFGGNDDWRINGSFKEGSIIRTLGEVDPGGGADPTWGLRGRVVFNNALDEGVWEDEAVVEIKRLDGSGLFITLTEADYEGRPYTQGNPETGPGGGAVGVASFELHDEGCKPPNGSRRPPGENYVKLIPGDEPGMEGMPGAVHVRHYGPVMWDMEEAEGLPVVIERRRDENESWIDITAYFEAVLGWADLIVALEELHTTECGDNIGFFRGFEYRITPVRGNAPETLRCLGVDGDPLVAHGVTEGYIFEFEVADPCPADLDADGVVGSADTAFLLGVWGDPCPDPPCICLADLNHDGMVGSSDLAILLATWGCGGESLMGGGLPPVVEHYEFESVEDYMNWLNSLSESELIDHIVEVIEWLTS